ncbi:cell division protein ZapA [Chitinophagaceae bacterium MMS25-I14]
MSQELIPINVWLAGRSYRIRIHPDEEEKVRKAVKTADDKISELRQHYAGRDDQDFVAMCLLMYAADDATGAGTQQVQAELSHMTKRISDALGE